MKTMNVTAASPPETEVNRIFEISEVLVIVAAEVLVGVAGWTEINSIKKSSCASGGASGGLPFITTFTKMPVSRAKVN
jgi:hypothetical protein